MLSHSNGCVIGDNRVHAKIYRRENEFFELLDGGEIDDTDRPSTPDRMMKLQSYAEHYKNIYLRNTREASEFFSMHEPSALFLARLEDPDKWTKLGEFLGTVVPATYNVHLNSSDSGP